MATRVLQKVQGALESTAGTFVNATRKLYGSEITHERTIASIRPDFLDGTYNQSRAVYGGLETNAFTVTGPLSFDQSVFWLSGAIGSASPSGGSAPYSSSTSRDVTTISRSASKSRLSALCANASTRRG